MKQFIYMLGLISLNNINPMESENKIFPVCSSNANQSKESIENLKENLQPNTDNTKIKNITVTVKNIEKFRNALKFTFSLNNDDITKLLGVNTDNLTFYVQSNNDFIDGIFKKWNNEEDIKNGTTLNFIKHSFLKMYRYNNDKNESDSYSFSLKINENFDIEKKIKIYIKYKTLNNEEVTIPVKDKNGNEEYTLSSLLYPDIEKYDELFNIIKDTTYCKKVGNFENSISINFKEDDKLLNNDFRNLLKICIEDENGNEIKDNILKKWVDKNYITNNSYLCDIKKGLFVLYAKNKFETAQKPYSFSMFYDNSKYKKIKIKIKLLENKYFYVKNKDNEVIDLDNLDGNNNVNNNKKNIIEKDNLTEEEFINRFKDILDKGIKIEKVGNFKNSIKFKFSVDDKILNESYRKNIKIQYYNEKDEPIEDCLFLKWVDKEEIKNGTALNNIKKGFLFDHPHYRVDDISKLFEISMFINKKAINKKVKVKISYNDKVYAYIKYKNSDILDLESMP